MNEILMVQILDYQDSPPSVDANFWWSAKRGITCDDPELLAELNHEGIAVPLHHLVYPRDGRAFLDALPFRFTGLTRAQSPVLVDKQEGASL